MRKPIILFLTVLLAVTVVSSCKKDASEPPPGSNSISFSLRESTDSYTLLLKIGDKASNNKSTYLLCNAKLTINNDDPKLTASVQTNMQAHTDWLDEIVRKAVMSFTPEEIIVYKTTDGKDVTDAIGVKVTNDINSAFATDIVMKTTFTDFYVTLM